VWFDKVNSFEEEHFPPAALTVRVLEESRLLADTTLYIDPSDNFRLNSILKDIVVLSFESTSGSLFFRARLASNGKRVFVKAQCMSISMRHENSGPVEAGVYLKTVDSLLADNITPHLVPCLGYVVSYDMLNVLKEAPYYPAGVNWRDMDPLVMRTSDEYFQMTTDGQSKDYRAEALQRWDELIKEDRQYVFPNIGTFLILEDDVRSASLKAVLGRNIGPEPLASILMQVLYTLEVFNEATPRLRHNDLHPGNILIDRVLDEDLVYILSATEAYRVPTRGCLARVFDFDLAYSGPRNTRTQGFVCRSYGSCNAENTLFDTFFIMKKLFKMTELHSSWKQAFPPQVRNNPVFSPQRKTTNPLFKDVDVDHRMCHLIYDDQDDYKTHAPGLPRYLSCNGEVTAEDLKALDLPTTRELLTGLGKSQGFAINVADVNLYASTTFFVSERLRMELQGKGARGAAAPHQPKQPQFTGGAAPSKFNKKELLAVTSLR